MANFIQKFENQSAYDAAEHQYPNTSLVGNEIVFAMAAPAAFGGLTVKYDIADPTVEVTLFKGGGGSSTSSSSSSSSSESGGGGVMPSKMYVDGVEETPINTWRFETAGEHIVQYEFADDTLPQSFIDDTIDTVTEAIVGTDITSIGSSGLNCVYLISATCLSTTPPTIGDALSFGSSRLSYRIYVPAESVATYKAATTWSSLETRIFAIQ